MVSENIADEAEIMRRLAWFLTAVLIGPSLAGAGDTLPLADYFEAEVARIEADPFQGIDSAGAWKEQRPERQRRLRAMLGLDPMPEKTDLHARITGTVERPDFVVEKLLYQSRPGLYVTANLYRPKQVKEPLPAILYLCGHAKVEKEGVIYGCKAHYQHHAAWFAANGYVCLVLDTLQLGELPGLHHGTYREGMWWWQSRGYTPAGVEAWNGIRGIDYLASRPEVDPDRIGVTGRSGGGATSWWVGALDDRVAAVVPVAGITDLRNHVIAGAPDGPHPLGVIEGHCDCMYPVNTDRWDFGLLASLVAPKPLLVENTDTDPIFPEDGVRRIHKQLETVYGWYDARDALGLFIGEGGHVDSEPIRHAAFAFFEKWLKGREIAAADIDEPDRSVPIEDLKVLDPGEIPPDCRNATIHETFVVKVEEPPVPETKPEWQALRSSWMKEVRAKVFGGWPGEAETVPLDVKRVLDTTRHGVRLRAYDFTSQPGVRLRIWWLSSRDPDRTIVQVLDDRKPAWSRMISVVLGLEEPDDQFASMRGLVEKGHRVLISPRGIGPTAWDPSDETQLRRRFALLGQTLDGMRVWDVHRALTVIEGIPDLARVSPVLHGGGRMAPVALWAALLHPEVPPLILTGPPSTWRDGPAFLNVERILGLPQAVAARFPGPTVLIAADEDAWSWPTTLGRRLAPDDPWPRIDTQPRTERDPQPLDPP